MILKAGEMIDEILFVTEDVTQNLLHFESW